MCRFLFSLSFLNFLKFPLCVVVTLQELRCKVFELLPFGFAPKSKETTSICPQMVFGVPTHLNNQNNLEDTNIDDNIDDQEDDVKQLDCKEEDIVKTNYYGDTRKSSKRS